MSTQKNRRLDTVTQQYGLSASQKTFVSAATGDSMRNYVWDVAVQTAEFLPDRMCSAYFAAFHKRPQVEDRLAFIQETAQLRSVPRITLYDYLTRDLQSPGQRKIICTLVQKLNSTQSIVGIRARANREGFSDSPQLTFLQRVNLLRDLSTLDGARARQKQSELTPLNANERVELIARWANEAQDVEANTPPPPSTTVPFTRRREAIRRIQKAFAGMSPDRFKEIVRPGGVIEREFERPQPKKET